MARRSPPRKVTYFEPVLPRLARNPARRERGRIYPEVFCCILPGGFSNI